MKRRSFLQGLGAGIAALFVPAVAARQIAPVKTLWVDGSNVFHEGKDGTFERPYLTLQKALDSCGAGDTIYIKSGHCEHMYGAIPIENNVRITGLGPDRPKFIWPTQ